MAITYRSFLFSWGDGPKYLKKLLSLQMIEEAEAIGDTPVWRVHEDGDNVTLILADAGFKALGLEREVKQQAKKKESNKKTVLTKSGANISLQRPGSKQAAMIALLQRPKGATIDELAEATVEILRGDDKGNQFWDYIKSLRGDKTQPKWEHVLAMDAPIHICDIELSDNRSKVPIELGESRTYTGLHVFGDFIDNLKKTAKENDIQRISLLVAFPELYPVFRRYGFNVSETAMSKKAFRNAGTGFAMILDPYRE